MIDRGIETNRPRKVFLASSGIQPETETAFRKLLEEPFYRVRVGFIPTPSDKTGDRRRTEATIASLKQQGFHKLTVIDLRERSYGSLRRDLETNDMLYVGEGNTFILSHWIKKSGLDKHLREGHCRHIVYFGSSAGSLVAGPSIELAGWPPYKDENKIGLKDSRGVGITYFAVAPHFWPDQEDLLPERYSGVRYPVIPITDQQAVMVLDGRFRVVGEGKTIIFNPRYRTPQPQVASFKQAYIGR